MCNGTEVLVHQENGGDKSSSVEKIERFLENMKKVKDIFEFVLISGTLLSAISTSIIIYSYFKSHNILFLMPMAFTKVSGNTFLLFIIPLILMLSLPVALGALGGLSFYEEKTLTDGSGKKCIGRDPQLCCASQKSKKLCRGWTYIQFIFWRIIRAIYNNCFNKIVDKVHRLKTCKLIIVESIFSIVLFSLSLFFLVRSNSILFLVCFFSAIFCVNKVIVDYFRSKEPQGKSRILPALLPTLGGFLFSFLYVLILSSLGIKSTGWIEIIPLIFPIVSSSGSFFFILREEEQAFNKIILLTVSLAISLIFFLLPKADFDNSYFRWMRYGDISVNVVQLFPFKQPGYPGNFRGMLLFNSGSELYIKICGSNQVIDPMNKGSINGRSIDCDRTKKTPSKFFHLYLKPDKTGGTDSAFNFQNLEIIRIPYKALETIPSF